ncbi:glycosyltransferase family 4 protein [Actinopolymorpha rutila]|uniref:Glycosyltransferase involved in cell wall biosynthesis n=1 Tax=Actinopolymorpha rutila TaxID=446787 RepID=A0A852ZEE6_9ACTN|nr:glycosyltransferase family 4 protein [Actinopolymorpha rutila]NYH91274.1 glycosyltransferase involved in cell wall biosynthesis [Actinopolymorpha rutila]
MPGHVIMIVRSWPRLSQTFILDEVLAMERRGRELTIVSLAHSGEQRRQPQVDKVRAPVRFLDVGGFRARWSRISDHAHVLTTAPMRYVATLVHVLANPGLSRGYATCSAIRCFDHAVVVAALAFRLRRSGARAPHVHAHFAHDPALVGMLTRRLTGVPFSFTAHARDLYQIPPAGLVARASAAEAVVTCCQVNADYIAKTVPDAVRPPVRVIHHGVELDRFTPTLRAPGPGLTLVSVGRLVEKKGFADLLRACAALAESGSRFRCEIYGDGPLRRQLTELSAELGLGELVSFRGERDRDEIAHALARTDVFVLTPCVTDDGDRDGIPNVLVEAMACAIPVVTTATGGVPELVRSGENGLIAQPGDVDGIAGHLAALVADPALRRRLGESGRKTVESEYDVEAAALALEAVFDPRTPIAAEVAP